MVRKLVVEGIGTFFLLFTIGQVVLVTDAGALAPLAIGLSLMVMVYAGGHVSGAHYNPAVTLAVRLRGAATNTDLWSYPIAQVVGALLAAVAVGVLAGESAALPPLETVDAILAEFLFTFALVWVILNVATARGTEGNSYFGLAIGLTVTAGAYAVGPISGAVFNPAVGIGILLLGLADVGTMLILIVVQLAAAVVAAGLFVYLDLGDDKPTTATAAEQAGLRPAAEPDAR